MDDRRRLYCHRTGPAESRHCECVDRTSCLAHQQSKGERISWVPTAFKQRYFHNAGPTEPRQWEWVELLYHLFNPAEQWRMCGLDYKRVNISSWCWIPSHRPPQKHTHVAKLRSMSSSCFYRFCMASVDRYKNSMVAVLPSPTCSQYVCGLKLQ